MSKYETIHFWEVPNADFKNCGVHLNRIDIPHKYYFKDKFFESFLKGIMYICKYDKVSEDSRPPFYDIIECNGDALVVVGRLNKK